MIQLTFRVGRFVHVVFIQHFMPVGQEMCSCIGCESSIWTIQAAPGYADVILKHARHVVSNTCGPRQHRRYCYWFKRLVLLFWRASVRKHRLYNGWSLGGHVIGIIETGHLSITDRLENLKKKKTHFRNFIWFERKLSEDCSVEPSTR